MSRSALALIGLTAALVAGAARAAPRDIEGLWSSASLTQLERPAAFSALVTPDDQAAAFEATHSGRPPIADNVGQAETEWWDLGAKLGRIDGRARSSWIVDPQDGRLPFTPLGLEQVAAIQAKHLRIFDGPEVRPAAERCLTALGGAPAPPFLNTGYNNHIQIVQTRDHVLIVTEMNHDARIIPLQPQARAPGPSWTGRSEGRWEGASLVVVTRGFHPDGALRAPTRLYVSPQAVVTERFTRVSADELRYSFTVEDPSIYTQPVRGELPLLRAKGPMFEFACHEGNYALEGVLAGARRQEAEAAPAREDGTARP